MILIYSSRFLEHFRRLLGYNSLRIPWVAPVQDVEVTAIIQEELAKRDLKPEEQIVDTGYVDAELLVSSRASAQDQVSRTSVI